MDIKILELEPTDSHYERVRFTILIDDIKVQGFIACVYLPNKAFSIEDEDVFVLRFSFDDPNVKKHPKYQSIRQAIIQEMQHLSARHEKYTSIARHIVFGIR